MRITTNMHRFAALVATANHIDGTMGHFSTLDLTMLDTEGNEIEYNLFIPRGPLAAQIAEIYARAITAAALEAAALSAIPVETVVEGEAA